MESINPERTYLSKTCRNSDRHKAGTRQSGSRRKRAETTLFLMVGRINAAITLVSATAVNGSRALWQRPTLELGSAHPALVHAGAQRP